jgi:hypothetical protein
VRNNGVPLTEAAPKAAVTQSILGLAESLSGDRKEGADETAAAVTKPEKSGLFSFLSSSKTKGK